MTTPTAPLVRFYDLSGPNPWSPPCWLTRFTLNFKQIPYAVTKISYPAIRPKCEALFPDMTGLDATVPIVEILGPDTYIAINDSIPIVRLLNQRFTPEMGYRNLEGLDDVYAATAGAAVFRWIVNDVYENVLDKSDGSREYFLSTREEALGCKLPEFLERGGGEGKVLEDLKAGWESLRARMQGPEGVGEPTFIDFRYASIVKWIQAASEEKYQKVLKLYDDDTFVKLMKKVEKYET